VSARQEPLSFLIDDSEYVGKRRILVVVHAEVESMHEWFRERGRAADHGEWNWEGITSTNVNDAYDIEIHLAQTRLWLSIIAHEATHAALFCYGWDSLKGEGARARDHVGERHSETIPVMVGNVTAHIIAGLKEHGFGEVIQ
jgi:hypothetical protein